MQTVPLSSLTTNNYQPTSQTLWLMENIFGSPACNMPSVWAHNSFLWAFVFIIILIILLVPLYWIMDINPMYMWVYIIFIIIILFLLIAVAGNGLINNWKSPRCEI